jgi:hypothetical protein
LPLDGEQPLSSCRLANQTQRPLPRIPLLLPPPPPPPPPHSQLLPECNITAPIPTISSQVSWFVTYIRHSTVLITISSAATKDLHHMTSTPHSLSCLCQPPRYRELGIDALTSAAQHFHGDCTPSFHLLTDNVSRVDPLLNPKYSPFRQWPDSGLSKVLNTTRITSLGVTWRDISLMAACAQPSLLSFCQRSLARPSTA